MYLAFSKIFSRRIIAEAATISIAKLAREEFPSIHDSVMPPITTKRKYKKNLFTN